MLEYGTLQGALPALLCFGAATAGCVAYATLCRVWGAATPNPPRKTTAAGGATPGVIVFTDVAKDIDDTVSLIYLCGLALLGRLRIVGVVCCGGNTGARAAVARHLLHRLLPAGEAPPVVAGHPTRTDGGAVQNADVITHRLHAAHPGTPHPHPCKEDISRDIASWLQAAAPESPIYLICLGPLTDLANLLASEGCLSRSLSKASGILVQGQGVCVGDPLREFPAPDPAADNLRCDMGAAEAVFRGCARQGVRMVLLGKHAAYQVPLGQAEVEALDRVGECLDPWTLRGLVVETLVEFVRDGNSGEILQRAYGVDRKSLLAGNPNDEQLAGVIWEKFPHVTVPYDPLCCMCLGLLEPSLGDQAAAMAGSAELLPGGVVAVGNTSRGRGVDAAEALRVLLETCLVALRQPRGVTGS